MNKNLSVQLLTFTPEPEKVIAIAAKTCYSKNDVKENLTWEEIEKAIETIKKSGHESPFEHASFTFRISGVSRTLLAQITRHRIASFSVQSQRYVDLRDTFDYYTPKSIANNEKALEIYQQTMALTSKAYEEIYDALNTNESGINRAALEDARYVLPNACTTKIVLTMNARELFHFFKMRCCHRAQYEIRWVATNMWWLLNYEFPLIFNKCGPGCINGKCPEGDRTCGHPIVNLINEIDTLHQ